MTDLQMIYLDAQSIYVDMKAVLRKLKIKDPDSSMQQLITECYDIICEKATPRAIYKKSAINVSEKPKNTIDFGYMTLESCNLRVNLTDCNTAYVFVATLGIEVDRIIEKYSKVLQTKSLICDTIASFMIEGFCNYINELLTRNKKSQPRFSPGYGDLSLSCQTDIINSLNATTKIGVALTDSYMMVPSKSVSAIIGVKNKNGHTNEIK